jgi:two-component system sensor histidine kinase TctE
MFSKRTESLRRQLLRWLLIPLVLLLIANAWFSNRAAVATADQAFDRLLLASAEAIGDDIEVRDGEVVVDLPYAALQLLESNIQERIFYRVIGPAGKTLTGYSDLPSPDPPLRPGQESRPYLAQYLGENIYLVALSKQLYGSEFAAPVVIIVAETGEARYALSHGILVEGIARQVGLIAAAGVLVLLGLVRGLRPLKRVRESVLARLPTDLSPIDASGVQTEVRPLIDAINAHTARIERLLASRKRFVADASHQMRTPLSEMRTQIEYVLRQGEPELLRQALEEVHGDLDRLSRLLAQLLLQARSEPDAFPAQRTGPVDLAEVARSCALDLAPAARNKGVDLSFEASADPPVVMGSDVLLNELVMNLVDNAISHGRVAGSVAVRVVRAGDRVILEIDDDGPSIAPAERERVFERFYRAPGAAPGGSGLGLSIVRDICTSHGAHITLATPPSGRGLRVQVSFAAAAAASALPVPVT